jgi:hypothetical protein
MDQIKEQLVKIKPYAFWIACVVILLGSLATWYMATAKLNEERAANESKIKNAFSGLVTIQPKLAKHPNPGTNAEMTKLTLAYGEEVARGWELQYQKQEGVLVWPESFDQDFHDAVKDLRPIEKVPVDKVDYKLTLKDDFRRATATSSKTNFPSWQKRSAASGTPTAMHRLKSGLAPRASVRMAAPTVEVDRSMVLWAPENQRELLATHFGFTARANDPSTLDVLYAQEDLWVLQNLMDIIKRTNEGAEGRHDAAVKQIEFVRIGRAALGQSGAVMMVGGGTGGPGESGFPTGPGGPGMEGMQPGVPAGPGAPAVAGETPAAGAPVNPTADAAFQPADPGNWRYVDKANTPLAGFQLRQAIAPTAPGAAPATPSPETVLLTVAKRMPVRIRLEIDQRRLNKLLTEFGNAQLPVEVRQLRINRTAAAAGDPGSFFGALGGGQGGGPGGGSMEGGYPIPGGMNQGGPNGPGNLTRDATVDTNLIKLELYGIVYLYNPVNRSVLGLPVAGPGATAMATPPTGPVRGS